MYTALHTSNPAQFETLLLHVRYWSYLRRYSWPPIRERTKFDITILALVIKDRNLESLLGEDYLKISFRKIWRKYELETANGRSATLTQDNRTYTPQTGIFKPVTKIQHVSLNDRPDMKELHTEHPVQRIRSLDINIWRLTQLVHT